MPDIWICLGTDCPLRESCYRFTATPSDYRQSYFMKSPYDILIGGCNYWCSAYTTTFSYNINPPEKA